MRNKLPVISRITIALPTIGPPEPLGIRDAEQPGVNRVQQNFLTATPPYAQPADITNGIRAVFFDCDGVIIQSQPVSVDRGSALFQSEAPRLLDRIRNRSGARLEADPDERTIYEPALDCRITLREMELLCDELSGLLDTAGREPNLIPGAREYLETHFGRHDFFLISTAEQDCLEAVCQQQRINHYFRHIAGGPRSKTKWLKQLLRHFKIDPRQSVLVGDTAADYQAAQKTGMRFVGVGSNLHPDRKSAAIPVISDLHGLDQALAELPAARKRKFGFWN